MKSATRILLVLVILLVGCKGRKSKTPTPSPTPEATAVIETQVPIDVSPLTSPLSLDVKPIIDTLRPLVAEETGTAPEELRVVSIEETMWRDTSLGCPQPGKAYAQVIVSGWRVVFENDAGQQYDVHTGEDPQRFVICKNDAQ